MVFFGNGKRRGGDRTPTEVDNEVLRYEIEYLRGRLADEINAHLAVAAEMSDLYIQVNAQQEYIDTLQKNVADERREVRHYRSKLNSSYPVRVVAQPVPMSAAFAPSGFPLRLVGTDESFFDSEETTEITLPPLPDSDPAEMPDWVTEGETVTPPPVVETVEPLTAVKTLSDALKVVPSAQADR